ncbi:hypothetical protein GCM10028828_16540 [Corynebacterium tapiri]
MKSQKSALRRGGFAVAAALSAVALAACSAGQISQTAQKVSAVDGAHGGDRAQGVSVTDVTVLVDTKTGEAAVDFVATNQDPSGKAYTLQDVSVDGNKVNLGDVKPIEEGCALIGDTDENLKENPTDKGADCTHYTATSVKNGNFAYGGNVPVEFKFAELGEPIVVDATVSAPTLPAGQVPRDYTGGQGETAHHH